MMWWKLTILIVATAGLIFGIIPIRTHAVVKPIDLKVPEVDLGDHAAASRWTFLSMVSNMYLTPGTIALICAILVVAGYIAFTIVHDA